MNALQPLLMVVAVALCSVGTLAQQSFRYEDGIPDARCPMYDNPMSPVHLAVANDCSKFQKCFNGRAFTIACPPGQEFGEQIQRCDYPVFAKCRQGYAQPEPAEFRYEAGSTDVRCPRFDDPFHPSHLAHPTDCRKFYKCFDGRAFELQCPEGQEWGSELNRCDYPFLARCTEKRAEEQTKASGRQVDSEDVDPTGAETRPGAEWPEPFVRPAKAEFSYSAGVMDARCPTYDDPYRPIHLAHPSDCRKFQKCFDGRAYTIECPPSQEFGVRINRCDYPQFAQCSLQKSRKASAYYDDYYQDEEGGFPLDSAEWTPEQREMVAGVVDGRCPETDDPSEPIHFTHPRDCAKFYKCYYGRAFLIHCPVGQHWSVRFDRCDYPKVAKCTIRGS